VSHPVQPKSTSFDLLHPAIQRWIWQQGWTSLRDIQEQAITPILAGDTDVLIGSATASGKTEAAFLPIASVLANQPLEGVSALCISPLKALINDQHRRLELLLACVDLPVHRWHGDVSSGRKRDVLRNPSGALLITPESLEALFIRQGNAIPHLFQGLRFAVVDEFHSFIGTERGRQLQSLLHRVELAVRRRVPRIALSATLGDFNLAASALRPGAGDSVQQITSDRNRQEVQLQVRGYCVPPVSTAAGRSALPEDAEIGTGFQEDSPANDGMEISQDLFRMLRGGRHLVFANRRADVELYTDLLRRQADELRVPNEFWPHHGSLDKSLREEAEAALKSEERPATVIATTTLELGIDVGSVQSIAQLGPPPSVASMRQRLGRSGRRGEPAVLRIFIREEKVSSQTPPQDQLRMALVQTIAMVGLLAARWYEPPVQGSLHLSTLIQQVLSVIAQHGEVRADQAWRALCQSGPFRDVDADLFGSLLQDLGRAGLISQTHTGSLVLDLAGERLVNQYDFYSAFLTPEEYRLLAEGKLLGTLPIVIPLLQGMTLIFGGRRWTIREIDEANKAIDLVPAKGGRPPNFGGGPARVHDRVRQEMRSVYESTEIPLFLNGRAAELLEAGRSAYRHFRLANDPIFEWGDDTILFPWAGDRVLHTLVLSLRAEGLNANPEGAAILIEDAGRDDVGAALRLVAEAPLPAIKLACMVQNKLVEKHHAFLSEDLLAADYASTLLDVSGMFRLVREVLGPEQTQKGSKPPEHQSVT
jgi:ATP-dependent Lhr-like helicase